MVEMLVWTNSQFRVKALTPDDIIVLTDQEAEECKPARMKNREMIQSLSSLDTTTEDTEEDFTANVGDAAPYMSVAELMTLFEGEWEGGEGEGQSPMEVQCQVTA
jgi:hypothetical protein